MNELAWWKQLLVIALLMTLGTFLYFSAAAFLNVWVVPKMQSLSTQAAHQSVIPVLIAISFLAAVIAAFFSVFLWEMTGGGRPLVWGVLFALPMVLIQTWLILAKRLAPEMALLFGLEMAGIVLAFLLMALGGHRVHRRFFSSSSSA